MSYGHWESLGGTSRHFLLVAGGERFDVQPPQQRFHLPVRQAAAFDARGRPDTLDGCYAPQCAKALRRKDAERAPSSLELIKFRQQSQKLGSNLEGIGVGRTRIYTGLHPNSRRIRRLNRLLVTQVRQ